MNVFMLLLLLGVSGDAPTVLEAAIQAQNRDWEGQAVVARGRFSITDAAEGSLLDATVITMAHEDRLRLEFTYDELRSANCEKVIVLADASSTVSACIGKKLMPHGVEIETHPSGIRGILRASYGFRWHPINPGKSIVDIGNVRNKYKINVEPVGDGMHRCRYSLPQQVTVEFVVSDRFGFHITEIKGLGEGAEPWLDCSISWQQAGENRWIPKRLSYKEHGAKGLNRTLHFEIEEFDLPESLPDETFQLGSINAPLGTRVLERRSGRDPLVIHRVDPDRLAEVPPGKTLDDAIAGLPEEKMIYAEELPAKEKIAGSWLFTGAAATLVAILCFFIAVRGRNRRKDV